VVRSLAGGARRRTSVATEGSGAAQGLAGGGEELERLGTSVAERSSHGWTSPAEKAAQGRGERCKRNGEKH